MKKHIIIIMSLAAVFSCKKLPTGPNDFPDTPYRARTEVGKMLEGCASIGHIYADSSFIIAKGVEETDMHIQTMEAKVEHIFILRVDLAEEGLKMKVGMPYDTDVYSNFQKQTPSDMIEYADGPGHRVVACVNGDFWDTSNGKIRGPIHRNGRILKETFIFSPTLTDQAISFFGFDYQGHPIIRDSLEYRRMQSELRDCTGSGVLILKDGSVPKDFSAYSPNRHPRNVVGYTPDHRYLYFMIADGRQPLWSDGMLYWEMGEIMKSLGCSWATNLDGGGSAQLVIRHPSAEIYQLRNRASDGAERAVVNTWMVMADEP